MNQLTPEQENIVSKVQKLIALAGNNSNEAEASAAMEKAMLLLAAYNLDMMTVERKSGKKGGPRAQKYTRGGLYKWQRVLWDEVAKLNFCMYWTKMAHNGGKFEHKILGSQANVIATNVMAQYLQDTIERLAREWAGSPQEFFTKRSISYRDGMAARVSERLRTKREAQRHEAEAKAREDSMRAKHPGAVNTHNALTIVDVINSEEDLNNDFLYGKAEGWHAQQRMERDARRKKAQEDYDAEIRKQEQWKNDNPEEWAAEQERQIREQERQIREQAEQRIKWAKEEEKRSKRRKGVSSYLAPRYKGDASAYYAGHAAGGDIGLDQQVKHSNKNKVS